MRRYVAGSGTGNGGTGGFVRGDSIWLPAALLATLALLVTALQAFGGEPQLQWRRADVPRPATNRTFKPTQQYAVQQAAYHDGTWQSSGPQIAAPDAVYRVAQSTPFGDDPRRDFDDDFSRELGQPFGETGRGTGGELDELPTPADELPLEPLPIEDDDTFMQERDPVGDSSQEFTDPFERQPPPVQVEQPRTPVRQLDRTSEDMNNRLNSGSNSAADDLTFDDLQRSRSRDESLAEAKLESEKNCDEELARLKAKLLNDIDLSIRIAGTPGKDFPFECKLDDGTLFSPRAWCEVTYMWKASAQCHKPLFFEDVQLERYGHSWGPGLQPIMSGVHFFSRLPVLPYCMGLTPPSECIYPLGYYRPGNCAPYMIEPIPFTWRAALFEAGAWTGGAAIVP